MVSGARADSSLKPDQNAFACDQHYPARGEKSKGQSEYLTWSRKPRTTLTGKGKTRMRRQQPDYDTAAVPAPPGI
jgi:hypothetical protein